MLLIYKLLRSCSSRLHLPHPLHTTALYSTRYDGWALSTARSVHRPAHAATSASPLCWMLFHLVSDSQKKRKEKNWGNIRMNECVRRTATTIAQWAQFHLHSNRCQNSVRLSIAKIVWPKWKSKTSIVPFPNKMESFHVSFIAFDCCGCRSISKK